MKYTEEVGTFDIAPDGTVKTMRYKISATLSPPASKRASLQFNAYAGADAEGIKLPYQDNEAAVIHDESDDEDGDEDYESLARNF
jgi:hypothetical protein